MTREQREWMLHSLYNTDIRENEPMRGHTSFKTGGNAALFMEARSGGEIATAMLRAAECGMPCEIVGNCTNLLVSERGVDALIIKLGSGMADIELKNGFIHAGAGALLSTVAKRSVDAGLMGLEWAAGIPGSMGGAVAMNAGAYGGETADAAYEVEFIENGRIVSEGCDRADFGYRKSPYGFPQRVVTGVTLKLLPDDGGARERMDEFTKRRREKQPLAYPSAGSVFKRPVGSFAGALIEDAGLKGTQVGGAEVSCLHAGFIINKGGATSDDVFALIKLVQKRVLETSGVPLETEVKLLGEFE